MYKILLKLFGNTIMKKIKIWLSENGFVGLASLVVAGIAMFMGMWFIVAGSVGFFIGKNWQIFVNLWNNKYKEIAEDVVDDLKDKIGK